MLRLIKWPSTSKVTVMRHEKPASHTRNQLHCELGSGQAPICTCRFSHQCISSRLCSIKLLEMKMRPIWEEFCFSVVVVVFNPARKYTKMDDFGWRILTDFFKLGIWSNFKIFYDEHTYFYLTNIFGTSHSNLLAYCIILVSIIIKA